MAFIHSSSPSQIIGILYFMLCYDVTNCAQMAARRKKSNTSEAIQQNMKLNLVQIVNAPKQIFWCVYVVVIATHYLPGLSLLILVMPAIQYI